MLRKIVITTLLAILLVISVLVVGCEKTSDTKINQEGETVKTNKTNKSKDIENTTAITLLSEITKLTDGLSGVRYDGDYGFDEYLGQGGASSDSEVMKFLVRNLLSKASNMEYRGNVFGCSTLSVKSLDGESLFGRNFDWDKCEALVVNTHPDNGYASISTVNMNFIKAGTNTRLEQLPSEMRTIAAIYAPLDGVNEKGLAISVNMIQDSATINQDTGKPDITTTTAIRLLLDKAANVDEALQLLEQYDMHASMRMMVHFALADTEGRSVVVEYVNNEMIVTDTPVVTNFYFAVGEKNGIGTEQSHTRYDILMERLLENETMSINQVKDALDSVSKDNFEEFESTEWSVVFNQSSGEVRYYHRENYENSYTFFVK